MSNGLYILDGHAVVAEPDLLKWAKWFDSDEHRRVAFDQIGDVRISTVFLGLDHRFGQGEPLLFETMIFGETSDGWSDRYSTWAEAEAGHARAVALVKGDV